MENELNPEILNLEDFELPENSSEDSNSKSFEDDDPTEDVKLKTFDGAQESEQSHDLRHGQEEVFEFKQSLANLNLIPERIFEMTQLRILNLSHNSISFIPDDIKKLTFLQILDLSHNNLTTLPNSFISSPWLKTLNISHNRFSHVPFALYKSAPCLRVLDMSFNFIDNFPRSPLCGNYLEMLILSSNRLNTVPRWIFDLKSLAILDLCDNPLANIPSNFLHERVIVHLSRSIKVLNLQNCQITDDKLNFVSSILDLETLILSNTVDADNEHRNSLQSLDANFISRAKGLKYLLASNVGLFFLHNNFDSLQNIQYLDLSRNGLVWLPNSFCNLANLTECKLNSNSISFLPSEFGKLVNLKKIFLSENNLVELPQSFASLVNLEDCDLYDNRLENFDVGIIKLKSLKGIDLEDNCLDFKALCGGEDLEEFYKVYGSLKEHLREGMEFERLDGQYPTKVERETRKINPNDIPDFIANYPSSEVYSLKTETPLQNWDEYSPNPELYNDGAGSEYLSMAEACPKVDDNSCACKYCLFIRSTFTEKYSEEQDDETETAEGQFDSD